MVQNIASLDFILNLTVTVIISGYIRIEQDRYIVATYSCIMCASTEMENLSLYTGLL